jgi:hypothetical protein
MKPGENDPNRARDDRSEDTRKRPRENTGPHATEQNGSIILLNKRVQASRSGDKKVIRNCEFCKRGISCSVLPSGAVHEISLRRHEKVCQNNPERKKVSVSGKRISDDPRFGLVGSSAEFQTTQTVLNMFQGSSKNQIVATHHFPDGSYHEVQGQMTKTYIRCDRFFGGNVFCCKKPSESILAFVLEPDRFPKLYEEDGLCTVAQLRGKKECATDPVPWKYSDMTKISIGAAVKLDALCLRCNSQIIFTPASLSRNVNPAGPCDFCNGNRPKSILYSRSFQRYLDAKGLKWITEPDASTILLHHALEVKINCLKCDHVWKRVPDSQVQKNSSCPGCGERHHAEARTFELYQFVYSSADMYPRGHAVLPDVSSKRFDVASRNIKVIVETMSKLFHVDNGRLPHDTSDMISALRAGYVYIMVHIEDHAQPPGLENAWKRCVVHALRLAKDDLTPRLLHVRRNASWDAYDCMRDAALEAGFAYFDIFCGHANAHATEKLPGEALQQTTLDPTEPT